jgi:hypothetical protein
MTQTLYAHMNKIKIKETKQVIRIKIALYVLSFLYALNHHSAFFSC